MGPANCGAISTKSGRGSVRWSFRSNEPAENWLSVRWDESGPTVVQPTRSGFGTSVARELAPYELAASSNSLTSPKAPAAICILRGAQREIRLHSAPLGKAAT
jgi:two-component sensor histidine kinase